VVVFESVSDIFEVLDAKSLNGFSAVGVFVPPPTMLPKSSVLPGVFGALEFPNEANAPVPKPKALDAPAVGDERDVPEGDMALKGFFVLCDEVSPCLLAKPNPRVL